MCRAFVSDVASGGHRGQAIRDKRATQILENLRTESRSEKYAIYLRSFVVTGNLEIAYIESLWQGQSLGNRRETCDLESLLAEAFEPFEPLVALGTPGEHIGAGRILTSDGSWREQIELLLRGAATIVMIPSFRSGTEWEIDWLIAHRCIERTLFIMPPRERKTKFDLPVFWSTTVEKMRSKGIHLPPFNDRGAIFTIRNGTYNAVPLPPRLSADRCETLPGKYCENGKMTHSTMGPTCKSYCGGL